MKDFIRADFYRPTFSVWITEVTIFVSFLGTLFQSISVLEQIFPTTKPLSPLGKLTGFKPWTTLQALQTVLLFFHHHHQYGPEWIYHESSRQKLSQLWHLLKLAIIFQILVCVSIISHLSLFLAYLLLRLPSLFHLELEAPSSFLPLGAAFLFNSQHHRLD